MSIDEIIRDTVKEKMMSQKAWDGLSGKLLEIEIEKEVKNVIKFIVLKYFREKFRFDHPDLQNWD